MQSWLEGRIWVGKGAQATGMTASFRIQSSKADSNTGESFTRSELKLESVHQESPRSDVFRKRATKPLLNQRQRQKHLTWAVEKKNWTIAQWSKVLFSDESKFCISFGNQGPRVWRKSGEAQNPCCLKSSVKFPQSVMIWAAMSSAGVGPLCFLKSTVNAAIYKEILEHFMLPSADKLYGDADFIFQQDLAPAHTAKGTKSWFSDHGFTVLDWPANSSDLNPIENLWGIVKRKMRDTRPNNADELKATVKETWASIHLHYIYIYAFSRRFYPKRLTLHSSYSLTFYQLLLSLGIEPMILALLAPCSTIWATGKQKIITIKRTKDLNYFSLCALYLFNTRVSQFELNYWNKLTFPRHSNLRCTCMLIFCSRHIYDYYQCLKMLCCPIFFVETMIHLIFQDSLNRKFKRTAFIWNRNL